jgi:hypothetical protein
VRYNLRLSTGPQTRLVENWSYSQHRYLGCTMDEGIAMWSFSDSRVEETASTVTQEKSSGGVRAKAAVDASPSLHTRHHGDGLRATRRSPPRSGAWG